LWIALGGAIVAALIAGGALLSTHISRAQTSGTITLVGSVATSCSISVTPSAGASTLDLSDGAKRINVGSVLQNCNKMAGYSLHVLSQNCATGTAGAKLIGSAGGEALPFSVEFNNPTTGGSQAVVTGLLATACSGAAAITGRDVTHAKITNENSAIFVNYTGNSGIAADSYSDTLTITLVAK
jgi:hypothetical protein